MLTAALADVARSAALAKKLMVLSVLFLPQGLDAPTLLAVAGVAVHPGGRPGGVLGQEEDQAGDTGLAGLAILQLGDRALLRVGLAGDVAVAPGEETEVEVAGGHVGQAFGQRALVGGDVIFHGDHVVAHLAQGFVDGLPLYFEVAVG